MTSALEQNATVTWLNLSSCRIGNDVDDLAKMLARCARRVHFVCLSVRPSVRPYVCMYEIRMHSQDTREHIVRTCMHTMRSMRSMRGGFIYIHTYLNTHARTYIRTHVHTYIHTYIHIHAYIHTYIHVHMHTHIHIHAYIHTYMSTHTNTYIHTHTHTYT